MNPIDSMHRPSGALTLQAARTRAGLSLREAATLAGTSHATLHAYETGKKTPSVDTFIRILEAMGFALEFELHPRIREADGLKRGEELRQVLELAEQFPARVPRYMDHPCFPRTR
ncbi:MAG: helix-turn-helix domain-containing protein [Pseudomonadota bacterium]